MNENYRLSPKIIMLFIGFVTGSFMGILFAASLLMFKPSDRPISYFEGFSLLVNTIVAVTAIAAIAFSFFASRMQKNQWLNESFIRREADILVELRDKYSTSHMAVHFFLNELLVEEKKYGYISESPPVVKQADIAKNFNILLDLNNLYNLHQNIFRKHDLEQSIECIPLILQSALCVPERDINYELIYQSEDSQTYRMEYEVLRAVVLSFNTQAHFLLDLEPGASPSIEQLNLQDSKDQLKEFLRFKELASIKLLNLIFDLDRLTMYREPNSSTASQRKNMRYFQKRNECQ